MKKKNGFTMIEILTIIFILALLFVIYNVLSNDILNKTNDTADDLTKQMILKAAESYVLEYRETPRDDNVTWTEEVEIKEDGTTKTSFCVSLNSLINYGYYKNDGSKFFDYKDNKAVYFEIENGVTTSKLVDLTTDNGKLNEECKYYIKNSSFTENTITNDNVEIYGGTDEIQIGSFEYDVKEIDGNKYSSSLNFKLDISPIFNQIKPINLILVLDATGSMGDADNKLTIDSAYGKAVDAMLKFTDDILSKPTTVGSNVALIEYGQTSVVRKNITTDKLKSDHFKFKNLGYTNVGAGIDMATSLIYTNSNINTKEQLENTYVILLYDGEPTSYSECIYTKDKKSITLKTEGNTNEQESKKIPYLKELNNNQYSISANTKNCFNQNCVDVYFNNYIKGWTNSKNDNFYCKQITNTNLTTNKKLTISRSKKQTVEASNFLKSFGVKLVTLGYNFKPEDEECASSVFDI